MKMKFLWNIIGKQKLKQYFPQEDKNALCIYQLGVCARAHACVLYAFVNNTANWLCRATVMIIKTKFSKENVIIRLLFVFNFY